MARNEEQKEAHAPPSVQEGYEGGIIDRASGCCSRYLGFWTIDFMTSGVLQVVETVDPLGLENPC